MKNLFKSFAIATALSLVLVGGGCSLLAPRTAALKSVHEVYRQEFLHMATPAPATAPTLPSEPVDFADSLRAIREFRVKYGEGSTEEAHLTVLEGMIYLQSGRLGMAKLVKSDIDKKSARLSSGTGRTVRDQLFADNFEALIVGWEQIQNHTARTNNIPADWRKLESSANDLRDRLTETNRYRFANPEVDQGGIYLATTAAAFYTFAAKRVWDQRTTETNWFNLQRKFYLQGKELIARFLSSTEIKAAEDDALLNDTRILPGRLRYLQWYGWLVKQLKS